MPSDWVAPVKAWSVLPILIPTSKGLILLLPTICKALSAIVLIPIFPDILLLNEVIPDKVVFINVDPDILDFKFNAAWVAVEISLFRSSVLSIFDNPTVVFVNPFTVPENIVIPDKVVLNKEDPDKLDFEFNAACVADEIALLRSLVLSTLPNPTVVLVNPFTVPLKVVLINQRRTW